MSGEDHTQTPVTYEPTGQAVYMSDECGGWEGELL